MPDPDWSDEHVSRANRFVLYVVVAWVALVTLQAVLAPAGPSSVLVTGAAALAATWLLVHLLFSEVDKLVKTRIAEAAEYREESTAESD